MLAFRRESKPTDASVYELATWNCIDTILHESGAERPQENLGRQRCPFASKSLANNASRSYPPTVWVGNSDSKERLICPHFETLSEPFFGMKLKKFPLPVHPGDRCLILQANDAPPMEGEFVGSLSVDNSCLTIKTPSKLVGMTEGTFTRPIGMGPNAANTHGKSALVVCSSKHYMLGSTLIHTMPADKLSILLETTDDEDMDALVDLGVRRCQIHIVPDLSSPGLVSLPSNVLEDVVASQCVIYVSGDPSFTRRALECLESVVKPASIVSQQWWRSLRGQKSLRLLTFRPDKGIPKEQRTWYPWDLISARLVGSTVAALQRSVVDLSSILPLHPGGEAILELLQGTDISDEFNRAHPQNQVELYKRYIVGSYRVPSNLKDTARHGLFLVRSLNVLELQGSKLKEDFFDEAPMVYCHRVRATIGAIDYRLLFNSEGGGGCLQGAGATETRAILTSFENRLSTATDPTSLERLVSDLQQAYRSVLQILCTYMKDVHECGNEKVLNKNYLEQHKNALVPVLV